MGNVVMESTTIVTPRTYLFTHSLACCGLRSSCIIDYYRPSRPSIHLVLSLPGLPLTAVRFPGTPSTPVPLYYTGLRMPMQC